MADHIYLIDPETKNPVRVQPVSFSEIGIKERSDLEQWIIKHPNLLGEDLLIITAEFDRFDKSDKRLDVLALDRNGNLVVVELKLDASRSLADQQAIRYAAMCSTMTMDDVISFLAEFDGTTTEEARQRVLEFLNSEELPELSDHPRIILAAGSMEDQELTTCVLWLRGFGLDISCIELTPYRLPESSQLIVVPKTVIPMPEIRDYQVGIERKQAKQIRAVREKSQYSALWQAIAEQFNSLEIGDLRVTARPSGPSLQLATGLPVQKSRIHYEWILRKSQGSLDVALHFESPDQKENYRLLKLIQNDEQRIKDKVQHEFSASPWGRNWAEAKFRLKYEGTFPTLDIAPEAGRVMKILVERTLPILKQGIRDAAV